MPDTSPCRLTETWALSGHAIRHTMFSFVETNPRRVEFVEFWRIYTLRTGVRCVEFVEFRFVEIFYSANLRRSRTAATKIRFEDPTKLDRFERSGAVIGRSAFDGVEPLGYFLVAANDDDGEVGLLLLDGAAQRMEAGGRTGTENQVGAAVTQKFCHLDGAGCLLHLVSFGSQNAAQFVGKLPLQADQ
jgi:hypothetical protein